MPVRHVCAAVLSLAFAGCASDTVKVADLRRIPAHDAFDDFVARRGDLPGHGAQHDGPAEPARPAAATPVVLAHDFTYDVSEGSSLAEPGAVRGLLAGTYVPRYEDAAGIYYAGIGTCVIFDTSPVKYGHRYVAEGGVWIAKDPAHPAFRLYRVPQTDRVLPLQAQASSRSPCTEPDWKTMRSANFPETEGMVQALGGDRPPTDADGTLPRTGPGAVAEASAGGSMLFRMATDAGHGELVFLPAPPPRVALDAAFAQPGR